MPAAVLCRTSRTKARNLVASLAEAILTNEEARFRIVTGNVPCISMALSVQSSVATKIENGPKTNTKILRFLKIDQRQIRRIFVNSKILRRSSKIANSSKIQRFSKENE